MSISWVQPLTRTIPMDRKKIPGREIIFPDPITHATFCIASLKDPCTPACHRPTSLKPMAVGPTPVVTSIHEDYIGGYF